MRDRVELFFHLRDFQPSLLLRMQYFVVSGSRLVSHHERPGRLVGIRLWLD
jgi:hypothetical protein